MNECNTAVAEQYLKLSVFMTVSYYTVTVILYCHTLQYYIIVSDCHKLRILVGIGQGNHFKPK